MFFKKNKKEKIIAVIEISSSSIGGVIFEQKKGGSPKILSLVRSPINFLFDVNFDAFWRCTLAALEKTTTELLRDYPSGPDECLCVFLSPWFTPRTAVINIERERAVKIDKKIFQEVKRSEEEQFKKHWSSSPINTNREPEFIEHEITSVELNGYYTKMPIGKTARHIKIYLFMSLGVKNVLESIRSFLFKNFGDIPIKMTTFPLLSFSYFAYNMDLERGFILVDIGGEITDISLFRKNNIEEIISFPKGRNFLLRKIGARLKTFPQEAQSLLYAYFKDHILDEGGQKISAVIDETREEWGKSFKAGLQKISSFKPLPQNILFIGEDLINKEFIKYIELNKEEFKKFTVLGQPFQIQNITFEDLSHSVVFGLKRQADSRDVFLLMESLFANKTL